MFCAAVDDDILYVLLCVWRGRGAVIIDELALGQAFLLFGFALSVPFHHFTITVCQLPAVKSVVKDITTDVTATDFQHPVKIVNLQ
jgi:hypothetical protein